MAFVRPQPVIVTAGASPRRVPELLAPAGDWECARAAVENGADAIYFGLTRFNARLRAQNFTEADLPELMTWLHRRGARGYVTFNTLVFTNELAEAEQYLRAIIAAGVDAAIVQDVGICRLIRRLSADFPIHASTQMTITSAAGVEFARQLGCERVVVARENSVRDLDAIRTELQGRGLQLPLEVFVHGALCVAYSGQCLTSEALGGRSANRGECAQACRLPYELVADGRTVPLDNRRYLLSPQDLAGLEVLPELVREGIASLKIEGRLKSPEYVASITRIYRAALDRLAAGGTRPARGSDVSKPLSDVASAERYEMEMTFSRGLYTGWLRETDNQHLVHARFGKKRGVFLGDVSGVGSDRVWLRLEGPLKPGDGIVFDSGRPDQTEEGGRVFEVLGGGPQSSPGNTVAITFGRGAVDFHRVHIGDRVWKTSDPTLERRLRKSFGRDAPQFRRPVTLEVHGHAGALMTLIARDDLGNVAQAESTMPLVAALEQPLDLVRLREQLGRLGGTPFHLSDLRNQLVGDVILPVSGLNQLRREAISRLEALRSRPKRWDLIEARVGDFERRTPDAEVRQSPTESLPCGKAEIRPELIVLVRKLSQIEAAVDAGVGTLYCELEDPKRYRDAVAMVRHRAPAAGERATEIWVAPPRIFKPGEDWILRQVRSSDADGYLVRNYDHLRFFADSRKVGDFPLNVGNPLAAEHLMSRFGLERLTASYDLNIAQLEALLRSAPPDWFEVTLHQHMPMFHMEHCVFCAFLSSGKDYRDCGRPCDRHQLHLRDRAGVEHRVTADAGCRNTVFNGRAQTGADHVARLIELGASRFRVELLGESPAEVTRLIDAYRRLLRQEITAGDLWREFKLVHQLGVTRGQLGHAAGADLGVNRWESRRG